MDAFETAHDIKLSGDDHVIPFQIEGLDVRGRAVQLGPMLDQILNRHTSPEPVAQLLAEAIVLTVLLGTSLKFDGNFILQTQSDGPVSLAVVDFSTPGAVRAYARYDAHGVKDLISTGNANSSTLLGKGVLAMTIDQGDHMQRYQGVVELDGKSLEDAAYQYFEEDEKGSIEVGKKADLVILDANPLKVEPINIKDIKVVRTIKDGNVVFARGNE